MSIIGINGEIGAGKDTVGKIIQYLTTIKKDYEQHYTLQEYLQNNSLASKWLENHSNFKIKKFADKLKDIVCILLGCTKEQLEDREFKEKELGKDWTSYSVNDNNKSNNTWIVAGKEKEIYNKYNVYAKNKLTPRLLLQLIGTECGRNIIHPNIWVNSLMSEYIKIPNVNTRASGISEKYNSINAHQEHLYSYPNWIITDMRFPNELQAVKDKGGISIRVNRKNNLCVCVDDGSLECLVECSKKLKHESETALDNYQFDYEVDNNSDINSLVEKVKQILLKEKII